MATTWETAMQAQLDKYKDDPVKLAALYRMYPGLQSNPTYSAGYTPEVKAAGDRYLAQRSFEPGVVGMDGSVVPRTAKPIENADDAYLYLGKDGQQVIRDATGYTGNFAPGDWSEFAEWFNAQGGDWNGLNHTVVNAARTKQGQYIGSDRPGYGFSYDPASPNYHWGAVEAAGPLLGPSGGPGGIAIPARPGGAGNDPYFGDYTGGPLFNPGSGGYVAPGGTGGADSPVGGGKAVRNMAALRPYMEQYPWMMPDAIYTPEMMYGDTMPILQRGIEQRFGWNPISIPTDMYYRPPIYRPETVNLQNLIPAAAAAVQGASEPGGVPAVGSPEYWESLRASGIYSR